MLFCHQLQPFTIWDMDGFKLEMKHALQIHKQQQNLTTRRPQRIRLVFKTFQS